MSQGLACLYFSTMMQHSLPKVNQTSEKALSSLWPDWHNALILILAFLYSLGGCNVTSSFMFGMKHFESISQPQQIL